MSEPMALKQLSPLAFVNYSVRKSAVLNEDRAVQDQQSDFDNGFERGYQRLHSVTTRNEYSFLE